MNCLILSKNRACQLHLLLESICQYAPNLFDKITIIYRATDQLYLEGYDLLQSRHLLPNLEWQLDKDFYTDFISYLAHNDSELFCGITDDCVFYRSTEFTSNFLEEQFKNPDLFCATLRMGQNTILQDYLQWRFQPPIEYPILVSPNFIMWNWMIRDPDENYGYPISLDGHIYRTKEMYDLTQIYELRTLRSWEGVLAGRIRDLIQRPLMLAGKESSLYSIPVNCCQEPSMIAGAQFSYPISYLNCEYLDGNIIDLQDITKKDVIWCHYELPLYFKNINDK